MIHRYGPSLRQQPKEARELRVCRVAEKSFVVKRTFFISARGFWEDIFFFDSLTCSVFFLKLVLRLAVLMMSLHFSSFLGAQANYQDGRVFFRMGPGHVSCL